LTSGVAHKNTPVEYRESLQKAKKKDLKAQLQSISS
jgi:hypothetical protein